MWLSARNIADEAARETKPPRIRAGQGFRCTSTREDGRFFAPLRMTCVAIALGESSPSCLRLYCYPLGPCRSLSMRCPELVEGSKGRHRAFNVSR